MNVKYFAIACSVGIFIFVIDLIRREKMTFKYALAWLGICITVLTFAIDAPLLSRLAHLAGFKLPSNFVFFLFLLFEILLGLLLTIYSNEQNKRSEILAQSVAILEARLKSLEDTLSAVSGTGPAKRTSP